MFTGIGGNKDLKQLQDLITAEKRIIDSCVHLPEVFDMG
jgi:hypothetical protein